MPEPMHIAFTLTRDYLPYAAVTLASVRHHLRKGDTAVFHILHGGDIGSADEAAFLGKLPTGADASSVRFLRVEDRFDFAARARSLPIRTPAAYYRLYIPDLFPHLDKLLYLDADLVVCRDPRELYDADMAGFALAGVEDSYGKTLAQCLYLPEDAVYLNGGVLLWNIGEIDRAAWWERIEFFLSGNHKYVMNASDQDVLALIFQGKMKRLDPCWNVQVRESESRRNMAALCGVHNSMTPEDCRRSFRTPGIAHYVEGSKPWSPAPPASRPDPLRTRWFLYAKMTGYYAEAWKACETHKTPARARSSRPAVPGGRPAEEPASPWSEALKASLKNTLLRQLHAQKREKVFSLEELAALPDRRLLCTYPSDAIRGGGHKNLFGLLFHTASMNALCHPDDLARAEGFVQGCFRDNWKLEEQACLYAAALEGRLDGYFAEIAFLTSALPYIDDFTIPLKYRRMHGFLVDDLGFYFDALLPSRLELCLNSGESALDEPETTRCRAAMRYIVENRLTKYNFPTLHTPALLLEPGRKVLVVDQCYGDASVTRGLAGPETFASMLEAAVRENPDAAVIVKTHPDTVTGLSAGYYGNLAEGGRIRKLTEAVNPHMIFPYVDKVYVCTSQLGFEALMAGKPVATFGMPIYAGWGLTDDRVHCPRQPGRRARKLSLEELFYGLYIRFCVYFNPYAPESCTLEEFMAHMVRLRAEYWEFDRCRTVENAAKEARVNERMLRHATNRTALSFDMESVFTRPASRIGSDLQNMFEPGRAYDPLPSLFSAASVTHVRGQEDTADVDVFLPSHIFRGAYHDALIAMLHAATEAGKELLWIKGGFISSILHSAAPGSHIPACYKRVLGYVVDDITPSFDAVLPSRLELYFNSQASSLNPDEVKRCREHIDYIVTNRLTKYNFQSAPLPEELQTSAPRVLVVDQTYGDASIRRGGADDQTFTAMLQAARDENPGAHIVVKTHPDVAALGKDCYYARLPEEGRLLKLTEPVNPYALFPHVDRVYVCTSQLGFEALLAGKQVTVFGLPSYAGWGLTDDRQACQRRTKTLTLEELFFGTFLKFGLYFNPHTLERCSFETFLRGMVRLRNEYSDFLQKYDEGDVYA